MPETITEQEREALRAAFFTEANEWHAASVAARDEWRALQHDEYTDTELVDMRAVSARVMASRGRYGAEWTHTPGTTERPVTRLAPDYAGAAAYAGLVDIDATRFPGLYLMTPRDSTPTWETDRAERPAKTPRVLPFLNPGRIIQTRPLTRADHVALLMGEPYEQTCMVPDAIVQASAVDPGGYFPAAYRLQRAATAFFAEHGEHHPAPDVFDVRRHHYHSRPDRVAFRGVQRVRIPRPCRYETTTTDRTATGIDGQTELQTRLTWAYYCQCGAPKRDACLCPVRGWTGHRFTVFPRTIRGTRAVKRSARPVGTGTRGPIAGNSPWTLSERSLARAAARVADIAADLESIVRTTADGTTITFVDGTTVRVIGAAQVHTRDRAFPVREWSRRAALSGTRPVLA